MDAPVTENPPPSALDAIFDCSITRDRLMKAMGESLIEKGFDQTVVADVVKRARVSRRTFYEEFSDRADCLLAFCERTTEAARGVIDAAADPSLPWDQQVARAIDAHFALMAIEPRLMHAMYFEIFSLGERGRATHRALSDAFVDQVIELASRSRAAGAEVRELSFAKAAAIVGAIFQLLQIVSVDPERLSVADARAAAIDLVLDATRPLPDAVA